MGFVNGFKMNLRSLNLVVMCLGIVAFGFALVFLLEAFEIAFPLLSLESQHSNFTPSLYSKSVCLFAAVGIGTFASYEVFFFPSYIKQLSDALIWKKIKMIFVLYHLPWCIISTYLALLDGANWNAWVSVAVMYGFTVWGAITKIK